MNIYFFESVLFIIDLEQLETLMAYFKAGWFSKFWNALDKSLNDTKVVGQLPETSVIQDEPNQKLPIDHTLGNILENDFYKP